MKKFILALVLVSSILLFNSNVKAESKVNVYMITKEGCPSCTAAYEYFEELNKQYPDLFELVPFEVFDWTWNWNSDDLKILFNKVYEYFKEDTSSASTPTIIIGDYHTLGLPSDKNIVYDKIVEAGKSGKDVVKSIAEKEKLNIEELKYDYKTEAKEDTKTEVKSEKNHDTLIVIAIFVIVIGGFASLIIIGKK